MHSAGRLRQSAAHVLLQQAAARIHPAEEKEFEVCARREHGVSPREEEGRDMATKPGKLSPSQLTALHSLFHLYAPHILNTANGGAVSADARRARLAWASGIVGRELTSV